MDWVVVFGENTEGGMGGFGELSFVIDEYHFSKTTNACMQQAYRHFLWKHVQLIQKLRNSKVHERAVHRLMKSQNNVLFGNATTFKFTY